MSDTSSGECQTKKLNEQENHQCPASLFVDVKQEEAEGLVPEIRSEQGFLSHLLVPAIRPEEVKTEITEETQRVVSPDDGGINFDPIHASLESRKENRPQQQNVIDNLSVKGGSIRPEDVVKTELIEDTSDENLGCCIHEDKEGARTLSISPTSSLNPEIKIHDCPDCNYKTIRKSDMTRHRLTHQGIDAMLTRKVYECDRCKYKSIRKCDLQRHKLVHKNIDDIDAQVYECSFCSYKSHRKNDLVRHSLIHKGNEEVNLFKCTYCPFQTKWRESFQQHIKSHMKPEDLDYYQCEFCGYQTVNKKHLRSHQLTHKSEEEVKMFTCGLCSYNSKRKCNLQRHLKTHTNVETKLMLPKLS